MWDQRIEGWELGLELECSAAVLEHSVPGISGRSLSNVESLIQNRRHIVDSLYRQYYWYDERGKKIKCTAPQYVDFVMSSVQKLVTDEDVFPTKYGIDSK